MISICLERERLFAGEEVRGRVILELQEPVHTRGVRLQARGIESTRITRSSGRGTSVYTEERTLLKHEFVLFGRPSPATFPERLRDRWGALLRGRAQYPQLLPSRYEYEFTFPLPKRALPSYEGKHAKVRYTLQAYVDVPLGRDICCEQELRVLGPRAKMSEGRAVQVEYPGSEAGLLGKVGQALRPEVRLRVILDRDVFALGETLIGSFEVLNSSGAQIRGLDLRLLAQEEARAKHQKEISRWEVTQGRLNVSSASYHSGRFSLELPKELTPTVRGEYFRLDYKLQVSLDIAWALDIAVEVPLELMAPP